MSRIILDDFKQAALLAAIQGYTTAGNTPTDAANKALDLIRNLEPNVETNHDQLSISSLSDIEKIEHEIGRKLGKDEKYHISDALKSGNTIDVILSNNPQLRK